MLRVGEALSFDLLGHKYEPETEEEQAASDAINDGLDQRNEDPVVESVMRYYVDPTLAGAIWLDMGGSGTVVGYSHGVSTGSTQKTGVGTSTYRVMPVEVSIIRIIDGLSGMFSPEPGQKIDRLHDEIARILSQKRRSPNMFGQGVQTISFAESTKLEGGGTEDGATFWVGRTLTWSIQRNWLDV